MLIDIYMLSPAVWKQYRSIKTSQVTHQHTSALNHRWYCISCQSSLQVGCTGHGTYALADGMLYGWGNNRGGRLCVASQDDIILVPMVVDCAGHRWVGDDQQSHKLYISLHWRHNKRDGVSKHQRLVCLINCLFRHRSKKTSKLRVTGLCEGNSSVPGEFPTQEASNAENVTIWWRHHISKMSFLAI